MKSALTLSLSRRSGARWSESSVSKALNNVQTLDRISGQHWQRSVAPLASEIGPKTGLRDRFSLASGSLAAWPPGIITPFFLLDRNADTLSTGLSPSLLSKSMRDIRYLGLPLDSVPAFHRFAPD